MGEELRGSRALYRQRQGAIEAWLCEQHAGDTWRNIGESHRAPGVICGRCMTKLIKDMTPRCLTRVAQLLGSGSSMTTEEARRRLVDFLAAAVVAANPPPWTEDYQDRHTRRLVVNQELGLDVLVVCEWQDRRMAEEKRSATHAGRRHLSDGEAVGPVAISVISPDHPDEIERFGTPIRGS